MSAVAGAVPLVAPRLLVVVPARDEEALLPGCLDALAGATEALGRRRPDVLVLVLVALDHCLDRTAQVAAAAGVGVVDSPRTGVGAARAAGVREGVRLLGTTHAPTWVACTDADSRVPRDWLLAHLAAAEAGAALALGPVDPEDLPPAEAAAYAARHRGAAVGDHVHGANLGVALEAYRGAGGFADLTVHEDVALVRALQRGGVVPAPLPPVATSARLVGRTPAGFAGYLRALSSETLEAAPETAGDA